MILVTVGTHEQPFDRLVRAADRLAVALGEEVVVQRGPSRVVAPHCTVRDWMAPSELAGLVERARAVVTHAGPASILLVRSTGKLPLVVPRRATHGEHVDDHQVRFCEAVAERIDLVPDPADLVEAVRTHPRRMAGRAVVEAGDATSARFAERLQDVVEEVVASPRRESPVRATFASILRRVGRHS